MKCKAPCHLTLLKSYGHDSHIMLCHSICKWWQTWQMCAMGMRSSSMKMWNSWPVSSSFECMPCRMEPALCLIPTVLVPLVPDKEIKKKNLINVASSQTRVHNSSSRHYDSAGKTAVLYPDLRVAVPIPLSIENDKINLYGLILNSSPRLLYFVLHVPGPPWLISELWLAVGLIWLIVTPWVGGPVMCRMLGE